VSNQCFVCSSDEACLSKLKEHLAEQCYAARTSEGYLIVSRHFLEFLGKHHIVVGAATPAHVEQYLKQAQRRYGQCHGHSPDYKGWWSSRTASIHMLLRLVQGHWPPAATTAETQHTICEGYTQWMTALRGITQTTVSARCKEACRFLDWLGDGPIEVRLANVAVPDVDTYMKKRTASLRRHSIPTVATNIRSFLRWLHTSGQTAWDLSPTVIVPTLYACESIPSALQNQDVKKVLSVAKKDPTPKGIRDYAILMLLSAYGMRAGEITALCLGDVDWRKEVIRIYHGKTGVTSYLPLLHEVGEALLAYLQRARPKTSLREIFLGCRAPYRSFRGGNNLYRLVERRLKAAGVIAASKRGSHTFRHTRAVSMLRAAVPVKEIGDLLGHRTADSTLPYLKLATEDLRAIALEIPKAVKA
jgi:integrase/recombinase XerD